MINRRLGILALLFISGAIGSCAQGAPAAPADASTASAVVNTVPVCGNGTLEMGEVCECMAGVTGTCAVTDPTATCEKFGEGPGVVLCDAAHCMYDMSGCMTTGTSGTGGSGTGG